MPPSEAEPELPVWGAPERNKEPISRELERLLVRPGLLLEIASGTGQHAAYFAERLPHLHIQPTDLDDEHLATLTRRAALFESEHPGEPARLLPPLRLDASAAEWPLAQADYVYCANMVHIAPLAAAHGLFQGAGRVLPQGGLLVTYGPYQEAGKHTAESNASFHASLRERNPEWGVRDITELAAFAEAAGLSLQEKLPLPANNSLLVFQKA
jgi:SAM-dependent methyltransferase